MNIASLLNLGGPDLLVILIIVLLLFGAKKLPELARGLGQAVREFSKAKDEFEHELTRAPQQQPQPQPRLEQPATPVPPVTADVHDVHAEPVSEPAPQSHTS